MPRLSKALPLARSSTRCATPRPPVESSPPAPASRRGDGARSLGMEGAGDFCHRATRLGVDRLDLGSAFGRTSGASNAPDRHHWCSFHGHHLWRRSSLSSIAFLCRRDPSARGPDPGHIPAPVGPRPPRHRGSLRAMSSPAQQARSMAEVELRSPPPKRMLHDLTRRALEPPNVPLHDIFSNEK